MSRFSLYLPGKKNNLQFHAHDTARQGAAAIAASYQPIRIIQRGISH